MKKSIVIGCDNAAVEFKNKIIDFVKSKGYEVEDVGVESTDDKTYYPLVAEKVCKAIIKSNYMKLGILFCGTGIGMCITANKFPGIYASVCHDCFSAERSKLSNNCNVICMGARVVGIELAKKIMGEWLSLEFVDGSSTPKVQAVHQIDAKTRRLAKS